MRDPKGQRVNDKIMQRGQKGEKNKMQGRVLPDQYLRGQTHSPRDSHLLQDSFRIIATAIVTEHTVLEPFKASLSHILEEKVMQNEFSRR